MKHPWAHPIFRSRFLLAIVAGLLWTCAFPKIGIAGLAWIAPGLMVTAALGKAGGEAFRIGYVAGLAHYLSMLYWLLLIPYRWHGLPLGPMLGWVALSAFLALFTAIWVWGMVAPVSGFRFRVPCSKPQVHSPTGQGQSLNTARVQRARPPTGESSPSPPLEERAGERRHFADMSLYLCARV